MLVVDHSGAGRRGEDAMQSQNRFFDDLARVAAGAVGTLSGVRSEVESRLRDQLERVLSGMDLVTRDEFEAVKAMAAKARAEQEDMAKRVAELEALVATLRDATASPSVATADPALFEPPISGTSL
jgi:BMFP domain-containing protein YqiC